MTANRGSPPSPAPQHGQGPPPDLLTWLADVGRVQGPPCLGRVYLRAMCGIAGFAQLRPQWTPDDLDRLSAALAHRGPDGAGAWHDPDGHCALAHRRLAIQDLSPAAAQPMTSACGRFRLVYNGELYNAADLARRWAYTPRTRSDTEILLEGLARFGTDLLPQLNGMFALACWDSREQSLLLARDRFGIKPLLWAEQGGSLVFASELQALLALPLPRHLDEQALVDYLFLEYIPAPATIFQGIERLEAGAWLRWHAGHTEWGHFVRLRDWAAAPRPAADPAEAADRFAAAIARHRLSDVPVGCLLSGGVDSSLVAAVARSQQPHMPAFTLGFDVPRYDETAAARAVARHLHLERHRCETLTAEAAEAELAELARWCSEPFAVPSVLPTSAVCRLAGTELRVVLCGDGGDELFMGYGSYTWYERLRRIAPAGRMGRGAVAALLGAGSARWRRAARLLAMPEPAGGIDWPHIWSQEQGQFSEAEIGQLLGRPTRSHRIRDAWARIDALPLHPWERVALFDLAHYLPDDLMYKTDCASMRWGVEARVPLLDLEWADYALALPVAERRSPTQSKVLLKRLLEAHLPHELVHRRKWGFPAPVEVWLAGPWAGLLDRYLEPARLRRQGLFAPKAVAPLVEAFRRGDHFHGKRLWSLLFFQLWYEVWMD